MRQRDEYEMLRRRISVISYAVAAVFAIFTLGFWHHQVIQGARYKELAEKNRIRNIPLVAPRGRIYDRYNRVLVDNRPSYNIVLNRENLQRSLEETVEMLASGIDMTVEDLMERIDRKRSEPKFRPILLKEDITVADIAFVRAHQYELPEISVDVQPRRRYVGGELAAHALGYVGEVTEAQLATREFGDFKSGDQVGQSGLERIYNSVLRGRDGFRRVVVDKLGREMPVPELGGLENDRMEAPATPGNDLHTTLDLDLQLAAEAAIGDRAGAAVALDPRTGEILALASKPAFDPNLFATRISITDWKSLINDPQKPLQNRAIQNHYSPGSVFKIFMAAAGLEAQTLDALDHAFCNGHAVHYGRAFACWKAGGHGRVGIHDAIVHSCNVFFYEVGEKLGINRIAQYTTAMGLGRKTGIDLPNEDAGLIPSEEWKQRVYKTKWYPGETISVSIGQGAVSVTPLQAAWAMGGLASGGRLKQPHLVRPERLEKLGFKAPKLRTEEYPMHQGTVDIVSRAMWGVVNEGGTGTRARVDGFDVAGKTGTAQVVGKQSYGKGEQFEDNAWFVGFAPYRNPEIAVGVFIEHGGHGGEAAAPVAHAIFDAYYRKKTGQSPDGRITAVAGGL